MRELKYHEKKLLKKVDFLNVRHGMQNPFISAKRINSVVRKTSGNENATIERMLSSIDTTYKTQMTTTSKPFPSSLSS